MTPNPNENELENWYRGAHEGGHAAAVWECGGRVTKMEPGFTHFDGIESDRDLAMIALAGRAAEVLLENDDIRGCKEDIRKFDEAIGRIADVEGSDAANRVRLEAEKRAQEIVAEQVAVIRYLAEPVGSLIHKPITVGPRELSESDVEAIARIHWKNSTFPRDIGRAREHSD